MKHGCGPLYLKWAGSRLYGPGRLPAGETVGLLGGLMTKLHQQVHIEMSIVRAFKRRLRQWSRYLPAGVTFHLVSRYVNSDVIGKTTGYSESGVENQRRSLDQ